MSRNVYVELDYLVSDGEGGFVTETRTFSITPDDTGEGRLMRPLKFSIKVRTWIQNESTSSGLSKITINNAAGELDSFADETFTECRIKEDISGTTTTLVTAQVDRVVLSGLKFLEINLKDATKLLDIPLQDDFFPASETADTGIGTNTYYALEGQPRPLSIGLLYSIKPVLASRATNEYHVHDSKADDIITVYDNGVSVTKTEWTKGFRLAVDPVGTIVADVRGAEKLLSTIVARRITDTLDWVFDKLSFTAYSSSDLSTINTDKDYLYSYYQDNTTNIQLRELIKKFCDSHTGWFYADESSDIRFGYLQEAAVTADVDVTQNEVVDGVKVFDDLAPNITTKLGCDRNWYVYGSDDIAAGATAQNKIDLAQQWRYVLDGANTLDDFYISTEQVFDTYLQDSTRAQDEIDNITDLYSQRRKFYSFQSTLNAEIGETVKLTYPRFGLDSGVNLLCVGREIDFIDNTYRLTLWG